MRVLVLAPYPLRSAPGQRFRFEQYIGLLANRGYAIDVHCLLDSLGDAILKRPGHVPAKVAVILRGASRRLQDLVQARRYDVAFVSREAFPLGPPVVERMLARLGVPYVFDFDDAIWQTNVSEVNRRFARLKFAAKTESIVRRAAVVSAGNDYLAAWARRVNDNVMVVPTTIDTELYQPRPARDRDPLCIGWSGSATTAPHLAALNGVLRDVQDRHGVRLLVIGPQRFSVPGADVETRPWRADTELEDLSQIDIGVMPLPDDPWARGKCGLKALQYMALGIPTVMSPVGVNEAIAEGAAAVLATSEEQWKDALGDLVADPAMRRRIGATGRRRVEQRYSVQVNVDRYVELLDRAASVDSRR